MKLFVSLPKSKVPSFISATYKKNSQEFFQFLRENQGHMLETIEANSRKILAGSKISADLYLYLFVFYCL